MQVSFWCSLHVRFVFASRECTGCYEQLSEFHAVTPC
jgi:hypothetical protein